MVDHNICKVNRKNRKNFLARRRRIREEENKLQISEEKINKRKRTQESIVCSEEMLGASSSTSRPVKRPCLAPLNFGAPEYTCMYCGAMFWIREALANTRSVSSPVFSLCCRSNKIQLPLLLHPPPYLHSLLNDLVSSSSKIYRKQIRRFNSMFAFYIIRVKVDNHVTKSAGPFVYRIHGNNYHLMGSLLPNEGHSPQFAQLYIYDTYNEIENRIKALGQSKIDSRVEKGIVNELVQMLDDNNELVKKIRMACDRFRNTNCTTLGIKLVSNRKANGLQYDAPRVSEIAGLIVGDLGCGEVDREIVIQSKTGLLHRIDMLHPSYMALQYPLLFSYGENGFILGLQYCDVDDSTCKDT